MTAIGKTVSSSDEMIKIPTIQVQTPSRDPSIIGQPKPNSDAQEAEASFQAHLQEQTMQQNDEFAEARGSEPLASETQPTTSETETSEAQLKQSKRRVYLDKARNALTRHAYLKATLGMCSFAPPATVPYMLMLRKVVE